MKIRAGLWVQLPQQLRLRMLAVKILEQHQKRNKGCRISTQ